MKILHVSAQKPDYTGSGIYLKNLIGWGEQSGHQQMLVAGFTPEDTFLMDSLGIPVEPVLFETPQRPFPLPGMSDTMPYRSLRYRDLDAEKRAAWEEGFREALEKARDQFQPDVIVSHHLWLLTSLVRRVFPDTPAAGISHGTDLRQMESLRELAGPVCRDCALLDRIFALNDHQREEILRVLHCPEDRVVVTGAGFDQGIFFPGPPRERSGPLRILYAGKLARAKGLAPLFRAVRSLASRRPVTLLLAGSGREEDELRLEAPPEAVFLGRLSQKQLGEEMRQADIFVLPSFYEGLPLVLLEALGSGIPVVFSDLPGVRSWLGEELMATGALHPVRLPRLTGSDRPLEEDLPRFEEDLEKAMERAADSPVNPPGLAALAGRRGWGPVFARIGEELEHLTKLK